MIENLVRQDGNFTISPKMATFCSHEATILNKIKPVCSQSQFRLLIGWLLTIKSLAADHDIITIQKSLQ